MKLDLEVIKVVAVLRGSTKHGAFTTCGACGGVCPNAWWCDYTDDDGKRHDCTDAYHAMPGITQDADHPNLPRFDLSKAEAAALKLGNYAYET